LLLPPRRRGFRWISRLSTLLRRLSNAFVANTKHGTNERLGRLSCAVRREAAQQRRVAPKHGVLQRCALPRVHRAACMQRTDKHKKPPECLCERILARSRAISLLRHPTNGAVRARPAVAKSSRAAQRLSLAVHG
jgi:hypothetical protein